MIQSSLRDGIPLKPLSENEELMEKILDWAGVPNINSGVAGFDLE